MLLTITTTHQPATDLGYLLHKNPASLHSRTQSYGIAHVFYPEARQDRCTAALFVEVDPVGLVRNKRGHSDAGLLDQYVNDRPYAASSLLSVAIADTLGSALNGRSADRPELAARSIPLELTLPTVPCRGGEPFLRGLFEPLGYVVEATREPLDGRFPAWGDSPYYSVRLRITATLQSVLTHLYVLIPVLDNSKHYWVGEQEVEKLLRHGEPWLNAHPQRDIIVRRYLKFKRSLTDLAIGRLVEADGESAETDGETADEAGRSDGREKILEESISLNDQRMATVIEVIEHLDPPRLSVFERVVFGYARPRSVILTTPNIEYNVKFPSLPAGQLRHGDHRFEWTRAEFESWATGLADRHGYSVRFQPIGGLDAGLGAPTQMAIFTEQ